MIVNIKISEWISKNWYESENYIEEADRIDKIIAKTWGHIYAHICVYIYSNCFWYLNELKCTQS